ncbi:hypothetical protein [Pseudoroseomonas ludipueritiae]|uniref:UrcA family protein n=1 Tax=Pseudoroseomonas ludipueritiae TaxID=198093 RepID=A0ABR7R8Z1_9PROT|nr:hypothetical protein [Pseudoroseomonas ludipueritiae]MBC9178223.1 hypothetical protein [Pseudoroseomonas ludipueritiae]
MSMIARVTRAPRIAAVPPFRVLLALSGLCLATLPAQAQAPGNLPSSQGTPASTGDAGCDEAAAAWRACIAASPKSAADKAQANTEVDKFVRDVFDARGPARSSLASSCPRTAEGYRAMLQNGTCAANLTGARDDQISRDQGGRQPVRIR